LRWHSGSFVSNKIPCAKKQANYYVSHKVTSIFFSLQWHFGPKTSVGRQEKLCYKKTSQTQFVVPQWKLRINLISLSGFGLFQVSNQVSLFHLDSLHNLHPNSTFVGILLIHKLVEQIGNHLKYQPTILWKKKQKPSNKRRWCNWKDVGCI